MTARLSTVVELDAATVYAEGVLAGLRTACNLIGRSDMSDIPPHLHAQVREWRARVYHNQWLAQQGRAAPCPDMPPREQLIARIHHFLNTFPDMPE